MNDPFKFAIIAALLAIVASLGVGLYYMVGDKGQSKRMVSALTLRIALSVALFIVLWFAWSRGYIHPRR